MDERINGRHNISPIEFKRSENYATFDRTSANGPQSRTIISGNTSVIFFGFSFGFPAFRTKLRGFCIMQFMPVAFATRCRLADDSHALWLSIFLISATRLRWLRLVSPFLCYHLLLSLFHSFLFPLFLFNNVYFPFFHFHLDLLLLFFFIYCCIY